MSAIFAKIIEFIKLPLRYVFSIVIPSGFMLFAPDEWLNLFYLRDIRNTYRWIIGLIFLISISIFASFILIYIAKALQTFSKKVIHRLKGIILLNHLNNDEKKILCHYLINDTHSIPLDDSYGIHDRLAKTRVLFRTSDFNVRCTEFSFNIQPWAFKYISKREHLIDYNKVAKKKRKVNSF